MSIGNELRELGFRANLDCNGQSVVVGSASFSALISAEAMLDPEMPLGPDGREYVTIEAMRSDVPSALLGAAVKSNQTATIEGESFKLVRRDDNASNNTVKFWAVKS